AGFGAGQPDHPARAVARTQPAACGGPLRGDTPGAAVPRTRAPRGQALPERAVTTCGRPSSARSVARSRPGTVPSHLHATSLALSSARLTRPPNPDPTLRTTHEAAE